MNFVAGASHSPYVWADVWAVVSDFDFVLWLPWTRTVHEITRIARTKLVPLRVIFVDRFAWQGSLSKLDTTSMGLTGWLTGAYAKTKSKE
jgi:hypothetical protein